MAVLNALLFAFNRNYLTLISVGMLLSALVSVAILQIFALALNYGFVTLFSVAATPEQVLMQLSSWKV